MTEEDPLSTQSIGVHVLKLIILVVGDGVIEGIKRFWEPPLITNAMLDVGEFTMFIYMLGALGQAFHWSWNQWARGHPASSGSESSLLRQFLPQRIDLKTLLRPPGFLLRVLVYVISFLLILFVADLEHCGLPPVTQSAIRLSNPNGAFIRGGSVNTNSLLGVVISAFNGVSVWLLGGAVVLSVLAVAGAMAVVIRNRRKR